MRDVREGIELHNEHGELPKAPDVRGTSITKTNFFDVGTAYGSVSSQRGICHTAEAWAVSRGVANNYFIRVVKDFGLALRLSQNKTERDVIYDLVDHFSVNIMAIERTGTTWNKKPSWREMIERNARSDAQEWVAEWVNTRSVTEGCWASPVEAVDASTYFLEEKLEKYYRDFQKREK